MYENNLIEIMARENYKERLDMILKDSENQRRYRKNK